MFRRALLTASLATFVAATAPDLALAHDHHTGDILAGVALGGVAAALLSAPPSYAPPPPVYVAPQPVYVQPQPVYVPPAPVYYAAPPVYYVRPAPPPVVIYSAPGYYAPYYPAR